MTTGQCYAAEWTGDPFNFIAPWGEEMVCNTGDYLCSADPQISEAYRIEREIFFETYREII